MTRPSPSAASEKDYLSDAATVLRPAYYFLPSSEAWASVVRDVAAALSAASEEAERRRTEECAKLVCWRCEAGETLDKTAIGYTHPESGGIRVLCAAHALYRRWPPAPRPVEAGCYFDLSACLTHKSKRVGDGDACEVRAAELGGEAEEGKP